METLGALSSIEAVLSARQTAAMFTIIVMAILLFGFQTAIGNVQTIPSDLYSGKVVGTLSGFAGTAAKLAGAGLTFLVPFITEGGNYWPAFILGGVITVIGLLAVWVLCPKIQPLKPN